MKGYQFFIINRYPLNIHQIFIVSPAFMLRGNEGP